MTRAVEKAQKYPSIHLTWCSLSSSIVRNNSSMANTRIIQGNKGVDSKLLIHDGYRYQLNKARTTRVYWRCWKKECRSSLKTNVFDLNNPDAIINVLHNADVHVHPQEDVRIEEQRFVQRMKQEITNNPTVPVKQVYDNVVGQAHQNARQNIPAGDVALVPSIPQSPTHESLNVPSATSQHT